MYIQSLRTKFHIAYNILKVLNSESCPLFEHPQKYINK